MRGPARAAREETTGQFPVAHVGGERDEPTLEMRDTLGAFHARHVEVQSRRGLTIRGYEIAEAHREVREGPDGERVEPGAGGAGHARERAPDDAFLGGHEPRHQPSDAPRQGQPRASRQPPEGPREPVEIGAVIGVRVPARSRDRVFGRQ